MKIALVSQEYPPETARGGIGSQTYSKAHGLARLGHEVYVISRRDTRGTRSKQGEVNLIRVPGYADYFYAHDDVAEWKKHSKVIAFELNDLHQRVGLDLIDFPEWGAEGYEYLRSFAKENGVPAVVQLHGPLVMLAHTIQWPPLDSDFYRTGTGMEAFCVRKADAVYSSSACSTRWIQEYYQPEKDFIPTIHLGIDTTLFRPQPVEKHTRLTIVFAGKIVRNKGVEELVEAAARLPKEFPGLQLRFLGRGEQPYLEYLQAQATDLGAPDLLYFAGFVEKEQLPVELSKAHLFAAPSYYEGGPGFVYLEAMACGLPVIGCSGSGIDEIVTQGINGLLVPPQNSKALEEAIHQLLADPQQLKALGENARAYAVREADTEICLKKLEAFYESVIQQHRDKQYTNPLIHE